MPQLEQPIKRVEAEPLLREIVESDVFGGATPRNVWRRRIMEILFDQWANDKTALISAALLAEKLGLPLDQDDKSVSERNVRQAVQSIRRDLIPAYYAKHPNAIRFELPAPRTRRQYRLRAYRFHDPNADYTWEQFMEGADDVGKKIFKNFHADILVTFPGPSLIFTGLVMARALSLRQYVRRPVYTLHFVDANMPVETYRDYFGDAPTPTKRFKILVPLRLTEDSTKRIAIVDDAILSGYSMQALRNYFDKLEYPRENIKFASCICDPGHRKVKDVAPDCAFEDPRPKPKMPWEREASCFEDGWPPARKQKKSGTSPGGAKRR